MKEFGSRNFVNPGPWPPLPHLTTSFNSGRFLPNIADRCRAAYRFTEFIQCCWGFNLRQIRVWMNGHSACSGKLCLMNGMGVTRCPERVEISWTWRAALFMEPIIDLMAWTYQAFGFVGDSEWRSGSNQTLDWTNFTLFGGSMTNLNISPKPLSRFYVLLIFVQQGNTSIESITGHFLWKYGNKET